MNFFKFLNFSLKSSEIPVGLRFQLASVTINFTDNRDYRAVLYSMVGSDVVAWSLPCKFAKETSRNSTAVWCLATYIKHAQCATASGGVTT